MASTNDIILQQYNSGGNWDEKLITPENGKVLGFDASLNPVQLSKQDTLVSGTNIKTVNGNSLLGSGDIVAGSEWTNIKLGYQKIDGTAASITGFTTPTINENQYFLIKLTIMGYFSYIGGVKPAIYKKSFQPVKMYVNCVSRYTNTGMSVSPTVINVAGYNGSNTTIDILNFTGTSGITYSGGMECYMSGV